MKTEVEQELLEEWYDNLDYFRSYIDFGGDKKEQIEKLFIGMLNFIFERDWEGACHATTAVMFIIAKELGFSTAIPCIGVVKTIDGAYFDHSWLEIDDKVFDVAIIRTLDSVKNGSPIYTDFDLGEGGSKTQNTYKTENRQMLDSTASFAFSQTIGDYISEAPNDMLWSAVELFKNLVGVKTSLAELKHKYKYEKWVMR